MAESSEAGDWKAVVAAFLRDEAAVEAVRIDPGQRRFAVATLGTVDIVVLQERIRETLREIDHRLTTSGVSTAPAPLIEGSEGNQYQLAKPTCDTAPRFWKWRTFEWPEGQTLSDEEPEQGEEWRTLAILATACGTLLAAAFLAESLLDLPRPLVIALYGLSMLAGGWDAAIDAFAKLKQRTLDIHFLMLAVAIGASSIGAYGEGALLLFLFSLSGALEHFAMYRTHREIGALIREVPETARRLHEDGTEEIVAIDQVAPGDRLRVRPDERFPVDGLVLDGKTAADESHLTGESTPVPKHPGDTVLGGTLNLWGVAAIEASRPAAESALQRVIRLVHEAQSRRAPSQRFTDRFGTGYTAAVLLLTLGVFLLWWQGIGVPAFVGTEVPSAFYRAMTFLVVASPCALVLSIPSAILAAIARGARQGILFRGGAAIERLAEVDTVALDKTGTLTTGDLRVVRVESIPEGRESDVAELAYSLEAHSNHPIARAITAYGRREGIRLRDVAEYQLLAGRGIRAVSESEVCFLGRRELVGEGELGRVLHNVPEPAAGETEVWVLHQGLIGRLLLRDELRTGSAGVIDELHRSGLQVLMLTGDRRGSAEEVGASLGIDRIESGLLPEQKVEVIRSLTRSGRIVAMVGDGVNDAPSLAAADVSVAMGARGSDAALEQADIVLMRDRIEKFAVARDLSLKAREVIRQNIALSLGTVVVMMTVSVLGLVPLSVGVVAHEGSTVLVCLNSLRLLFHRKT